MITQRYQPSGKELVGFGKYGYMTFRQLRQQRQYCEWVTKTAKEADSPHWRLLRLVRWLDSSQGDAVSEDELALKGAVSSQAVHEELRELKTMVKALAKLQARKDRRATDPASSSKLQAAKELIEKLEAEKLDLEHQLQQTSGRTKGIHEA